MNRKLTGARVSRAGRSSDVCITTSQGGAGAAAGEGAAGQASV